MTTTLAAKIAAVGQELDHEIQRIRGRRELTDAAKRERIARVYLDSRDAVRALRKRQATLNAERVQQLQRDLFGTTTAVDLLAARDARDRVRRVTDRQELIAMLREAESVRDTSLSRAIAERAARERDDVVLSVYVDEFHPGQQRAVQDLLTLTYPDDGQNALGAEMAFGLVPPGELAGLADDQLQRLAGGRVTAVAS